VLSAPALRCRDTVDPLASACGLPVELDPAFSDAAYEHDPERTLARLCELAALAGTTVVASQGGVVPGLVETLSRQGDLAVGDLRTRKGAAWVLSLQGGRLVDVDLVGPLA